MGTHTGNRWGNCEGNILAGPKKEPMIHWLRIEFVIVFCAINVSIWFHYQYSQKEALNKLRLQFIVYRFAPWFLSKMTGILLWIFKFHPLGSTKIWSISTEFFVLWLMLLIVIATQSCARIWTNTLGDSPLIELSFQSRRFDGNMRQSWGYDWIRRPE